VIIQETDILDLVDTAPPRLDGHRRHVDRISQAVIEIDNANACDAFASVRDIVVAWLQEKAGQALPETISGGGSDAFFPTEAQRVETAATDDYWAARQDDPDRMLDRRTWVTEIGLAMSRPHVLRLGFRLDCITRGEAAPFERSVPRFMRDVVRRHRVRLDGVEVGLSAGLVDTEDDVEALLALLSSDQRCHPVIGVSLGGNGTDPGSGAIDPDRLASALLGTAHVRAITRKAATILTERIGPLLSVFNRAVRTWNGPLDADKPSPRRHPLVVASRIDNWSNIGPISYARFLTDQILAASAERRDADDLFLPFAAFHGTPSTPLRKHLGRRVRHDPAALSLLRSENRHLAGKLADQKAEYDELLAMAEADLQRYSAERDDACAALVGLRARVAVLEDAIQKQKGEPAIPIPDTLAELDAWGATYLGNGVVLLPRAITAAKKSEFEDIPFVYRALLMIRNNYVPMRRTGDAGEKAKWEQAMSELGLVLAPTFAGDRAGEHGETYIVSWEGHKRALDMHFKSGSARDHRYCFRLYFFWDQESKRVVVGSLPGHLATRTT
jgi:hypothetical protein